jgi:hypothetical protein
VSGNRFRTVKVSGAVEGLLVLEAFGNKEVEV